MRHYAPQQRTADGQWFYCCGGIGIGYCEDFEFVKESYEKYDKNPETLAKLESLKDKFHGHAVGHATKEEACDCYRQYLIDFKLHCGTQANQMSRCQECQEFTQNTCCLGPYRMLILCDNHKAEEFIKKHLKIGESWES